MGLQSTITDKALWDHRRKKNQVAIDIATDIIHGDVSKNLFNNIIDKDNPKVMWEKFKAMCSQVGPGITYLILQELFTYLKINKFKGFEKSVTSIFAKVTFLVKRLRVAVTLNKNIWDSIAVVIAIESLHDNFEYVILVLLRQGREKSIDEI